MAYKPPVTKYWVRYWPKGVTDSHVTYDTIGSDHRVSGGHNSGVIRSGGAGGAAEPGHGLRNAGGGGQRRGLQHLFAGGRTEHAGAERLPTRSDAGAHSDTHAYAYAYAHGDTDAHADTHSDTHTHSR